MPNFDVIEDTNSYHGIKTRFAVPKGFIGKGCTECPERKSCDSKRYKECEGVESVNAELLQKGCKNG